MNKIVKLMAFIFISYVPFHLFSYQLSVACMFRNETPYLREWIEYHKMVGVEHFWLYNDKSTDNWEEILAPYIEEGSVEVFDWPTPHPDAYSGNQCAAFRDALKKGKGVTSWLAFIDIDEFILPMKEATITECLEKHFAETHAIYVNWRCFGSGKGYIPKGDPLLFELTACSLKNHSVNCIGKTIVRPEFAEIDMLWYVHWVLLKDGSIYRNGDGEVIPIDGGMLKTDGFAHAGLIRINHYVMRDRGYFENVRLERARNGYNGYAMSNEKLLLEQNEEYCLIKDHAMINFIKKFYPESQGKFGGKSVF